MEYVSSFISLLLKCVVLIFCTNSNLLSQSAKAQPVQGIPNAREGNNQARRHQQNIIYLYK